MTTWYDEPLPSLVFIVCPICWKVLPFGRCRGTVEDPANLDDFDAQGPKPGQQAVEGRLVGDAVNAGVHLVDRRCHCAQVSKLLFGYGPSNADLVRRTGDRIHPAPKRVRST